MRESILIITADFYPFPSNNTVCFTPFIYKLAEIYDVHIVTSDLGAEEHPFADSVKIYRIANEYYMNSIKWSKRILNEKNNIKKNLIKLESYLSKISKYLKNYQRNVIERGYIGWNKQDVIKCSKEIIEKNNVKKLITLSIPYITCDIALKIKEMYKNDIIWNIVGYDALYMNDFYYHENTKKMRLNLEKIYFKNADTIFLTPQIYKSYTKDDIKNTYSDYKKKMYSLEYVNLTDNRKLYNEEFVVLDDQKTSLFYAGNLDENVRPITNVLRFLSQTNNPIMLNLVVKSDLKYCSKEIEELGEKIKIFSRMEFDEVYSNEMAADYLLSIGNNTNVQVPGKTFELMSTGKPIVHFSLIEDDPVLDYLNKYENFLLIKLYEDYDYQIDKFNIYINQTHKCLSYEEVLERCTEFNPKHIIEDFINKIR